VDSRGNEKDMGWVWDGKGFGHWVLDGIGLWLFGGTGHIPSAHLPPPVSRRGDVRMPLCFWIFFPAFVYVHFDYIPFFVVVAIVGFLFGESLVVIVSSNRRINKFSFQFPIPIYVSFFFIPTPPSTPSAAPNPSSASHSSNTPHTPPYLIQTPYS